MPTQLSMTEYAQMLHDIIQTDRFIMQVVSGEMGEGKSRFTDELCPMVARLNGTPYTRQDNMTYLRSELKTWVDGDKDGKGQKPEGSVINADELISMFFKRNWYDFRQISGIELLNKCRDRHHLITGNIPNFWDLDSGIYPLITFWVHIPERGVAWIFQKDKNPFVTDKWHRKENEKRFIKEKNPYRCIGFVAEIHFTDWSEKEKEAYYAIRNSKRLNSEGQGAKLEKFHDIIDQRNKLISFVLDNCFVDDGEGKYVAVSQKTVGEVADLTQPTISYIQDHVTE